MSQATTIDWPEPTRDEWRTAWRAARQYSRMGGNPPSNWPLLAAARSALLDRAWGDVPADWWACPVDGGSYGVPRCALLTLRAAEERIGREVAR